jgi:hypothetical protein
MPDVGIDIFGTTDRGDRTQHNIRTDATGHYAIHVPDGTYRITASTRVQYNGRSYQLPLDPTDGIDSISQYSAEGLIKDFAWRISGPEPAGKDNPNIVSYYYGGYLKIRDDAQFELLRGGGNVIQPHEYPEGASVELKLTPKGPLLDGSKGEVQIVKFAASEIKDYAVWDVPLGDYTATVRLIEASGKATALHVATISEHSGPDRLQPLRSAPVVFLPHDELGGIGTYGVEFYILP